MSDQDYFLRYAWCYVSAVYVTFIMYIYRTSGTLALISVNADYNDRYCCYTNTFHRISHLTYSLCDCIKEFWWMHFASSSAGVFVSIVTQQVHSAYTCRLTRSIFPWVPFGCFNKYNLCLFQYFSFNRFDVSLRRKGAQSKDNAISMHRLCPEQNNQ